MMTYCNKFCGVFFCQFFDFIPHPAKITIETL
jgi:hypothetical protein